MKKILLCFLLLASFIQIGQASSLKSEKILAGKDFYTICDLGGGSKVKEVFNFSYDSGNSIVMRANGPETLEVESEEVNRDHILIKTAVYDSYEGHLGLFGKLRQKLEIKLDKGVPAHISFKTLDLTLLIPITVSPKYDCSVVTREGYDSFGLR